MQLYQSFTIRIGSFPQTRRTLTSPALFSPSSSATSLSCLYTLRLSISLSLHYYLSLSTPTSSTCLLFRIPCLAPLDLLFVLTLCLPFPLLYLFLHCFFLSFFSHHSPLLLHLLSQLPIPSSVSLHLSLCYQSHNDLRHGLRRLAPSMGTAQRSRSSHVTRCPPSTYDQRPSSISCLCFLRSFCSFLALLYIFLSIVLTFNSLYTTHSPSLLLMFSMYFISILFCLLIFSLSYT